MKIRINGESGALLINEASPTVEIYYRNQLPKEHRQRRVAYDNDLRLADHFANAIDTAGPTIMDARASLAVFNVCAAAIESARTGRAMMLE